MEHPPPFPHARLVKVSVIVVVLVVAASFYFYISAPARSCDSYPLTELSESVTTTNSTRAVLTTSWLDCSSHAVRFVVQGGGTSNSESEFAFTSLPVSVEPGQSVLVQVNYNPTTSLFSGTFVFLAAYNATDSGQIVSGQYAFTA
ncbi:MAG TPA: hypothetical protein VEJ36_02560 [Nitrososphaerales archaeon]|nr:hypothetical protein [Nitrososphaerales archaeon]